MADKTDPAPAEEQPPVADAGPAEAPVAAEPVPLAPAVDPAEPPEQMGRADTIAALIRNGLSNSPISQSETTWQALETRLPEIVAAILEA
jgi:hypothetical protein